MILNSTPENQAIMSNVGEIGEFRIRNSAKAFNILSSGLYANKIRAIIRELSCNAVDSHTAAGKSDVPFEVHVPNSLEPFFRIRDFGTGLTHEQVTSIYTTYFESTKTDSNAFIGALGLGSKSPFSYTDNFTVTAIKDGKRGVYSAFINGEGVPSIALMMTEETTDPAGVEIQFSVNDRYDFYKFREEAANVYRYFKLRPLITGDASFKFSEPSYETKDIIPGVHTIENGGRGSVAVMGNIAYPIQVPNAESTLGQLQHMLGCGLEMHFEIGELDFQASREGLSYIPSTIEAIKRKLTAVRDQLSIHIKEEAEKIDNLWLRAEFLAKKHKSALWAQSIDKYALDTKLPTYEVSSYNRLATKLLKVKDLEENFNLIIRGTSRSRGSRTMTNLKPSKNWDRTTAGATYFECWHFTIDEDMHFVINDTKVGALERAKHHYREAEQTAYNRTVMVLEAANKDKAVDTAGFFAAIHNPPEANILKATALNEKPRKDSGLGKNVTILHLEERKRGHWSSEVVWTDAGKINSFDANKTHYYVPLSGFQMQSKFGVSDAKDLRNWLRSCGISGLATIEIHGVRKGDMEDIKTRANWVNLEDHIVASLQVPDQKLIKSMVVNNLTDRSNLRYNSVVVGKIADQNSPYAKLVSEFKGVEKVKHNDYAFRALYRAYAASMSYNPEVEVAKYEAQFETLSQRYPLLQYIYGASEDDIANYINLIDKSL